MFNARLGTAWMAGTSPAMTRLGMERKTARKHKNARREGRAF
jgi:hypothetical protein